MAPPATLFFSDKSAELYLSQNVGQQPTQSSILFGSIELATATEVAELPQRQLAANPPPFPYVFEISTGCGCGSFAPTTCSVLELDGPALRIVRDVRPADMLTCRTLYRYTMCVLNIL